jgi:hypothetical protein
MECSVCQHTDDDVQSLIVGQLEQEIHSATAGWAAACAASYAATTSAV